MKYSRGEIAKLILKTVAVGTLVVGTAIVAPGIGPVLNMFVPRKSRLKFSRSLSHLERQKLVTIAHKGKETIVTITKEGKRRLLKYNYEEMVVTRPKRWDGWWRIVIFDIPNKKTRQRDLFRVKLSQLGFYMIQQSTFILPYPVKNEIDFLGEYLGIRKHITYILARKVEGANNLREIFKLK